MKNMIFKSQFDIKVQNGPMDNKVNKIVALV
jgi:hypothetical protein